MLNAMTDMDSDAERSKAMLEFEERRTDGRSDI